MTRGIHRSSGVLSVCCLAWLVCASARAQFTGEGDAMRALVALGVGAAVGARTVALPAREGKLQLETGIHPALDLALSLGVQRGRWSLSVATEYRSSIGLRTESSFLPGETGRAALRSHSLYAGLVPSYGFGPRSLHMRVSLFSGWMVRALRTVATLNVPNYSLHGLVLRPELEIALVEDRLSLQLQPELGVIVFQSQALREVLDARQLGVALGAAVALDARVSDAFHILAGYQLTYASQSTAWHGRFTDTEHFVHVRFELRY